MQKTPPIPNKDETPVLHHVEKHMKQTTSGDHDMKNPTPPPPQKKKQAHPRLKHTHR